MSHMKILDDKVNHVFNRKEIKASIEAEKVPSKQEVEKMLSEKFSAHADCIAIKSLKGKFGSHDFKIIANIYHSKEDKEKTEPKPKAKKEGAA